MYKVMLQRFPEASSIFSQLVIQDLELNFLYDSVLKQNVDDLYKEQTVCSKNKEVYLIKDSIYLLLALAEMFQKRNYQFAKAFHYLWCDRTKEGKRLSK